MNTLQVTITVGHNVQGVPTHTTAEIVRKFAELADVDGFSYHDVHGYYLGQFEDSTAIVCNGCSEEDADALAFAASEMAREFAQECVDFQIVAEKMHAWIEPGTFRVALAS